ncbi:hypothetical protein MYAM1_000041 [Malassezia yamatoensis]|uniref:Uncharacterized protein n=1 Tax=Malassezia yamatoensis TaxID=253288 RepID=A0AAJ6CH16_9BASI|nr:hypothetical protein MYAM1_000041 [Malassezia yamatoensis]
MQQAESIVSTLGGNELDALEKYDALFDEDILVMARVRVGSTGQHLGSVVSRGVEKRLAQRSSMKFLYSLVGTNEHTLLDFCRCGQGNQSETVVFLPGTQEVVAKVIKEEKNAEMYYRLSNQRETQMCNTSPFQSIKARAKDPIHVFRRGDNQVVATAENYYTSYS